MQIQRVFSFVPFALSWLYVGIREICEPIAVSNYGLVVAAGAGTRFGGRKQFYRLGGRPLVCYALSAFERCPVVKETVLVVNLDMIDRLAVMVRRRRLRKVRWIIAGGEQRQDSVARGLRVLPERGMVAIHDGVRPFLRPEYLTRGFAHCRKSRAVIYGLPVFETVKETRNDTITRTVPRENLVLAQTPQFFALALIKEAYDRADHEGFRATDDAQLVERLGAKVTVLPGCPENIKITTRVRSCACRHREARASFIVKSSGVQEFGSSGVQLSNSPTLQLFNSSTPVHRLRFVR
jgi:2-C-methyl-D-erythritol 4-phosphate cytidylyltransferase